MAYISRQNILDSLGSFIVASVGTELSNRIYNTTEAPQNEAYPNCIFFGVGDAPVYAMGDKEFLDANYQVSFFIEKDSNTSLRDIVDTLNADLTRADISITGFDNEDITLIETGRETITDDVLQIIIEFRIQGF